MSNITGISLEMPQLGVVLFGAAQHMICVCRDGVVVGMNPVGERWLGCSAAAVIGRPFSDLVHPDYRLGLADGLGLLLGQRVMMTLHCPSRLDLDVEVEAVPLDDTSSHVVVTVQDLDEKVAVARELVASEQLLRRLIDLSNDGVAVVARDRVRFVNAAGLRMLGARGEADVLGRPIAELLHPSFRLLVADGLALLAEENDLLPVRLLRQDGGTTDVELRVRRLGEDEPDTFVLNARDITQLRQSAVCLRESHERLQGVLASVADGILTVDPAGLVVSFNRAAEEIFGCTAADIQGKPLSLLIPEAAAIKPGHIIDTFLARTRSRFLGANRETIGRGLDGRALTLEISCADLHQSDGRLLILAARNVSDRKAAEEKIRYQATHDELTGLPNRAFMFVKLEHVVGAAVRHRRKGALLLIDVDDFKLINDALGHDGGDRLLAEVAKRLRHVLRREDFLARFAGDQFVAIIPEMAAGYEAAITARRIIDMMEDAFSLDDRTVMLTVSVGIVSLPDDGEEVNDLIKNASAALSRAKDMSKGAMAFFTPDLDNASHDRVAIRSALTNALERDEFFLLYQPKIDLSTGRIAGVEALLRWRSPDHGVVSPAKFIPILEESNLIVQVGQWVLETACRQQKAWDEAGFHHIRTAVNLSVRQIRPGLVSMVESVLAQTGLPPRGIEIEITESLVMRDPEEALAMLRALSELGIHLSIDDFGTGYSSLSYLRKLPLNTIKIDRSFVTDMATDEDDAEIVRTIIAMGHSLRRRIVAEGVETGTELALLREFNCDEVQGFLFSRPVPAEQITELLKTEPFTSEGEDRHV